MRIGQVPVTLHPLFALLALLIGFFQSNGNYIGTAVWVAVIFVSVLLHELGHALTARYFGQRAAIELVAFGGLTTRTGPRLKLWQDFLVVFNGPLTGLLLFLLIYLTMGRISPPDHPIFFYALEVGVVVNLFWTLINLLPIMPLDGGQLMTLVLEGLFGFKGVKASLFISLLIASLVGFWFVLLGSFVSGALFLMLAFESYRSWKGTLAMTDSDRDEALQRQLLRAKQRIEAGQISEGQALLSDLRARTPKGGLIQVAATELYARTLVDRKQFEEAYNLFQEIRRNLSDSGIRLLHQVTYRTGRWQESIDLGKQSFNNHPSADTAVAMAIAHASLKEVRAAIGWLLRAKEEGLADLLKVADRAEFAPLRDDPQFQELLRSCL